MENSGSLSRKRSSSNHMDSSDDPGDRSLINFFPPEPKHGRIEYRTMENISGNCPIPAPEVMVGSTGHDHEEPNLDLSLQIGLPRTILIQNQRAQFQAPPAEDKLAKSEPVRAELARAQEENRFLKEKLGEANIEHKALHDLLLELTESRTQVGLQGGATVSPSSSDQIFSDHDRSSPSNSDQTQPTTKNPRVSVRIRTEQPMKLSKGSPFPRAYGRCSVVKGCSVQKKVQRCAEDPTALKTTYEGPHNHVLPLAAVATANATSAATSTLMSGSSSSAPVTSNNSTFLAGATISAAEPVPAVMIDHTRRPPAVAGISELTRDISSDPRVKAAPVSAITASSEVPQGDGDSQEKGKKERSE